MDFCKCGSIIVDGKCTNVHCPIENQKSKGWIVDGKSIRFMKPVSFEDASEIVRRSNNAENK